MSTFYASYPAGSGGGSVSVIVGIGTYDGNTPSPDGLSIATNLLYAQSASATFPGMVNTAAQTFAGVKTLSSAPVFSSLTASLPLQLDGSKNVVSAAIDLSGSQVTGALAAARFPALTGDVTTSAGSLATSLVATTNSTLTTLSGLTSAASLATVGTISSGVWSATAIAPTKGGTGLSSYALGDLIYSDSTNSLAKLSGNTASSIKLLAQTGTGSVSAAPVWNSATGTGNVAMSISPSLTTPTLSGATLSGTTAADILNVGGVLTASVTSTLTGKVGIGAAGGQANLQLTSPTALTGTLTNSAGGTAVTGVGTKFRTEVKVGTPITMNGETQTVATISSNTALTTSTWTGANSGVSATRAATPNFYVYPNGNTQAGGTITSADGTNGITPTTFQVVGDSATSSSTTPTGSGINVISYVGASTGGTGAPNTTFIRAAGNEAAQAAIASGDTLGRLLFRGASSSSTYITGADIDAIATEAFSSGHAGSKLSFLTVQNATTTLLAALTLDQDQSVVCGGGALATNATGGFFYMTSCAGTPTGVPVSNTGRVPWVYDSTNNIIYVYNGAWKKTAALT